MTAAVPRPGGGTSAAGTVVGADVWDLRFPLPDAAGSDARHGDPLYSLPVCLLHTADGTTGTGITLTLGAGNELVCQAVATYAEALIGHGIEAVVASLGAWWVELADHSQLRWLGPHKGVTHLALASVLGAVVDAWARLRGRPLWELLLERSPAELLQMVDRRTLDDVLPDATALIAPATPGDLSRLRRDGLPGYDTSVGWLGYPLEALVDRTAAAVEAGFGAVKVKIGSPGLDEDVRRVAAVREVLGPDRLLMVDANQSFTADRAIEAGRALADLDPFWFEEPVHPDDLVAYRSVRAALGDMRIAGGEHLPNQVAFKTFLDAGVLDIAQPDVVRVGGLPEFLGAALLASHHGVPVAPHVGDMGQLHQHLVPLLTTRLGAPSLPLEHIPHLRSAFAEPAAVLDGRYRLPEAPGASTALAASAYEHGSRLWSTGQVPRR